MKLNKNKQPDHEANIQLWFSTLEPDEQTKTVAHLTFQYYKHLGLTSSDGVKDWLCGVADGTYPHYSTTHLSLRRLKKS